MKKMRLDVDALAVESFETDASGGVLAAQYGSYWSCNSGCRGETWEVTCYNRATCCAETCNALTCPATNCVGEDRCGGGGNISRDRSCDGCGGTDTGGDTTYTEAADCIYTAGA